MVLCKSNQVLKICQIQWSDLFRITKQVGGWGLNPGSVMTPHCKLWPFEINHKRTLENTRNNETFKSTPLQNCTTYRKLNRILETIDHEYHGPCSNGLKALQRPSDFIFWKAHKGSSSGICPIFPWTLTNRIARRKPYVSEKKFAAGGPAQTNARLPGGTGGWHSAKGKHSVPPSQGPL